MKRPHIEKPAQCLAPNDTAGIEPIKPERWPDVRFRGEADGVRQVIQQATKVEFYINLKTAHR